jgi:hypothetical protein
MKQELPIAECRLDLAGLRRQRDRYRKLGDQALDVRRDPDRLTVTFGPELNRDLLEEVIATENECCPFFAFEYSPEVRVMTVGVSNPEFNRALDAIAYALGDDSPQA